MRIYIAILCIGLAAANCVPDNGCEVEVGENECGEVEISIKSKNKNANINDIRIGSGNGDSGDSGDSGDFSFGDFGFGDSGDSGDSDSSCGDTKSESTEESTEETESESPDSCSSGDSGDSYSYDSGDSGDGDSGDGDSGDGDSGDGGDSYDYSYYSGDSGDSGDGDSSGDDSGLPNPTTPSTTTPDPYCRCTFSPEVNGSSSCEFLHYDVLKHCDQRGYSMCRAVCTTAMTIRWHECTPTGAHVLFCECPILDFEGNAFQVPQSADPYDDPYFYDARYKSCWRQCHGGDGGGDSRGDGGGDSRGDGGGDSRGDIGDSFEYDSYYYGDSYAFDSGDGGDGGDSYDDYDSYGYDTGVGAKK